ncbi:MAG: hypothetical protein RR054_03360 [Clostridia bacterium]
MRAIFFVLKNTDLLTPLLNELKSNGITGGTIVETKGMATEMVMEDDFAFFGALRHLLKEDYKATNTLIFVANEEKEKIILAAIEKTIGKLDQPNTGIIFAFPVDYTIGLKF